MQTRTHNFWTNWLLIVSFIGAVMGATFAFTSLGDAAMTFMADWSSLPSAEPDAETANLIHFAIGLTGAVMLAWCVALGGIAHYAFRNGERWAWTVTATSVLVWFVVDGYVSITTGLFANVVGNILFLILFEIPLAATFNSMVRSSNVAEEVTA